MRVPPVCVCMIFICPFGALFTCSCRCCRCAVAVRHNNKHRVSLLLYVPFPYSYCSFYFICYSLLLLPLLLNSLSSFLPHSLTKPLNACCAAICHKFSLCCSPTALPALLLCCDCGNCHSALQPTSLSTSPSLSSSSAPSPSLCVLLLML